MKFNTEEAREKFLHDEAFWESNESYCLGNTMKEAGKIANQIIKEKESKENVGMDNGNT